jgi:hypothetical protein
MSDHHELRTQLTDAIARSRDRNARHFKPVCVIAMCTLLDDGSVRPEHVPLRDLLERFAKFVEDTDPDRKESGFSPAWHLTSNAAWVCFKDGRPVSRQSFSTGRPKSLSAMVTKVDSLRCSDLYLPVWKDRYERQRLVEQMLEMMDRDTDELTRHVSLRLRSFVLKKAEREAKRMAQLDAADRPLEEDLSRLRTHLRRERDPSVTLLVKKRRGYVCEACKFDFAARYGELGRKFIEAHHVVPVSKTEAARRQRDINHDFVVLCSNCHRMIHRLLSEGVPNAFDSLKQIIEPAGC